VVRTEGVVIISTVVEELLAVGTTEPVFTMMITTAPEDVSVYVPGGIVM
jgi:hypothetical protein